MGSVSSFAEVGGSISYNLVAIPLLAALLFVILIIPRAALKSLITGLPLLIMSWLLALVILLLATVVLAGLVPEINRDSALVRVCAAALLLAAWLIPRELKR